MAVALRFAAEIAEVNSYARGDLLDAAGKLHSVGAPQAQVIRSALGDRNPDGPISGEKAAAKFTPRCGPTAIGVG